MKKLTAKELMLIKTYQHNLDALCNIIENTCNDEYERGFRDGFDLGFGNGYYSVKEV